MRIFFKFLTEARVLPDGYKCAFTRPRPLPMLSLWAQLLLAHWLEHRLLIWETEVQAWVESYRILIFASLDAKP